MPTDRSSTVGRARAALNALIQGSAADLLKQAAIELHETGLAVVVYIHDEVVLEVDEDQAEDSAATLSAILATGAGKVDGLRATAKSAARWSDCK